MQTRLHGQHEAEQSYVRQFLTKLRLQLLKGERVRGGGENRVVNRHLAKLSGSECQNVFNTLQRASSFWLFGSLNRSQPFDLCRFMAKKGCSCNMCRLCRLLLPTCSLSKSCWQLNVCTHRLPQLLLVDSTSLALSIQSCNRHDLADVSKQLLKIAKTLRGTKTA